MTESARLFLSADGESDKRLGNEAIRWDLDTGHLEVRLPTPLAHLTNTRHGRYRVSCQVRFPHRGGEVAAQTSRGAARFDITFDPDRGQWYRDASWTFEAAPAPTVEPLAARGTFAVDLNADHVAGWVVDPAGNPVATPRRSAVPTSGSTEHRDAQVRHLVTRILRAAHADGCASVTVENLDFAAAVSRDNPTTPRGRRGRRLRGMVAGIPTGRFRDRLAQLAANTGMWVVAIDPAYTSRWGRKLLPQLSTQTPDRTQPTFHDGAAAMVGGHARGHGLPPGVRTLAPSPADDGRVRAAPNGRQPTPARQRVTAREPSAGPHRPGGTRPTGVARSRQHRSDGTTTGIQPAGDASWKNRNGGATYREPEDGVGRNLAELDADYPFTVVTFRLATRTKARTAYDYWAIEMMPENHVEIHPRDAATYGITTGDRVRISSRSGSAEGIAKLSGRVRPGVLAGTHHFGHTQQGVSDWTITGGAIDAVAGGREYSAVLHNMTASNVDGDRVHGDDHRAKRGFNVNDAMRRNDDVLDDMPLVDNAGGGTVFLDSRVRIERVRAADCE